MTPLAGGRLVALSLRADALADDCARAALVVALRQPPPSCAAAVIDRERLRRQGALGLRESGGTFRIEAVRPAGTDRPWSPAVKGEGEIPATLTPHTPVSKTKDATPPEADLQMEE